MPFSLFFTPTASHVLCPHCHNLPCSFLFVSFCLQKDVMLLIHMSASHVGFLIITTTRQTPLSYLLAANSPTRTSASYDTIQVLCISSQSHLHTVLHFIVCSFLTSPECYSSHPLHSEVTPKSWACQVLSG